jgi:hypothetical protein
MVQTGVIKWNNILLSPMSIIYFIQRNSVVFIDK